MADGYIDTILFVIRFGNRIQGGDGTALNNIKPVVCQAPLDVLWVIEMLFYFPADTLQFHYLFIGQYLRLLHAGVDRLFIRASILYGINSQLLGRYHFICYAAVAHFIVVSIYQAGNHGFSQSPTGINRNHFPVSGEWIGRKHDTRRLREYHFLNDHRHANLPVIYAVLKAVYDRPAGKKGCPAFADMLQDLILSDNVQ